MRSFSAFVNMPGYAYQLQFSGVTSLYFPICFYFPIKSLVSIMRNSAPIASFQHFYSIGSILNSMLITSLCKRSRASIRYTTLQGRVIA